MWLGPCISQEFYAVGTELEKQFIECDAKFKDAFQVFKKQIFMDIRLIAQYQIKEVLKFNRINGVFNSNDNCTYRNGNLFFSHRRESRTGRQCSLIFKNKT